MTSISSNRLSNSSIETAMDNATPKRPARAPARQGSISASGNSKPVNNLTNSSASNPLDHLQPRTLLFSDSDRTPRKTSPLPTPPSSETTSNGSGSGGKGGGQSPNQSRPKELGESTDTVTSSRPRSSTASFQTTRELNPVDSDTGDNSLERPKFSTLGRRRAADLQRNGPSTESSSSPSPLTIASRLHRKTSSMTIRSGSSSRDDPMTPGSASGPNHSTSSSLSRRGSVTEPRQKRSALYEQQRSESRLGRRLEEARSASRLGREEAEEGERMDSNEPRFTNTRSSSSSNLNSSPPKRRERTSTSSTVGGDSTTTDTSGTEGAGSVSGGRRRRKKSSASSRGKANSRKGRSSPISRQTEEWARDAAAASSRGWPSHSRMESEGDDLSNATQRNSRRRNQPNGNSPGANSALQSFPSQRSPSRSILPHDFRHPASASASASRYRSDSMYDDHDNDEDDSGLSRPSHAGSSSGMPPRRRHASDAAQIPTFEYQGRGGTKDSRLYVDSGAATRHLMRASSNGPDTLPTSQSQEWGDLMSSPSEDARVRKVSQASSNSNSNSRSSGGHSDRFRSSSRLSSRDADVFGDSRGSPAPGDLIHKMERVESKQRRLAALEAGGTKRGVRRADYDELRSGIEQLPLVDAYDAGSRSPSLTTSPQPRSATNSQFSDYASQGRPSTEPRRPRNAGNVAEIYGANLSIREREQAWNDEHQVRQSEELNRGHRIFSMPLDRERAPMTPDAAGPSRPDSVTRIVQSATIPQSSRFSSSSSAHGSARSGGAMEDSEHVRLMKSSFAMFERHFSGAGGSVSSGGAPSTPNGAREFSELVETFADATSSIASSNRGLYELQSMVLRASIAVDTNPDYSSSIETLGKTLDTIDKSLMRLLRQSDDQVRLIAKGLIGFTKAEAEKDRIRRAVNSENGSVGRPSSRMSSMTHATQLSPRKSKDLERLERGHSIDLRSTMSSRAGRSSPTRNHTADWVSEREPIQAVSSNSAAKDLSRRSTIGRSGALAGSSSPYSPTPRTVGQEFPSLSRARTSMTSHGRSASEITSNTSDTLRRGKASAGSNSTVVRPPTSLSPRKPKLSFPSSSQSHATASFANGSSEVEFDADSSMESAFSTESGVSRDSINREGTLPRSLAKALSARHAEDKDGEGHTRSSSRVSRRYTLDESSRPTSSTSPNQSRRSNHEVTSPSLSQSRSFTSSNSSHSPQVSPQMSSRSSTLNNPKRNSSGGTISRLFNSKSLGRSSKRDSQILSAAEGELQQAPPPAPSSRRGSRDLASITRALQNQ